MIKEKLKLKKGSGVPQTNKVGKISLELIQEIAEIKMPDLNANTVEQAVEMIRGTAKSMGIEVG